MSPSKERVYLLRKTRFFRSPSKDKVFRTPSKDKVLFVLNLVSDCAGLLLIMARIRVTESAQELTFLQNCEARTNPLKKLYETTNRECAELLYLCIWILSPSPINSCLILLNSFSLSLIVNCRCRMALFNEI